MINNTNNELTGLSNLKATIPLAFRLVFLNPLYIVMAVAIFTTFGLFLMRLISYYFFHL